MISTRLHKHVVLANDLRRKIRSGGFGAQGKIPTERELCNQYGCSRGTVRQALRSLAAQGLVRSQRGAGTFAVRRKGERASRTVAVVVPNVTNSEIAGLVHVLSGELIDRGYHLSLWVTNDRPKTERKIIAELLRSEIAGVLKFPTDVIHELEIRARFREAGIPCIVINDFWVDCHLDHHVAYDEQAAMTMAVDHLTGLGHQRIGLLDSHISPRVRAITAYRDALKRHNLPADDALMLLGVPFGPPALGRLYHEGGLNPTALITMFDIIAERVIVGLRQMGRRVPEDVSVANVNGPPLRMRDGMDLTTAVPPNEEIAAKALDILEGWTPDGGVRHELLKPDFHVGHSTGPCAENDAVPMTAAGVREEAPMAGVGVA